jgi:hypothetical protein
MSFLGQSGRRCGCLAFVLAACLSLVCGLGTSSQAALITTSPTDLWSVFPKTQQGENGIHLQYRPVGTSNYQDLAWHADYSWTGPGVHFPVPEVARLATPGDIFAHPAAVVQTHYNNDAVLRVGLEGSFSEVHVTGSTGMGTGGSGTVTFSIYQGATEWSTPLWSGSHGQGFDLTFPSSDGQELFFATNAGTTDMDDWAHWFDIQITAGAIPEPSALAVWSLLAAAGIGLGRRLRKSA